MNSESSPMLTPTEVLEYVWCPRFIWFINVQHIPQHEDKRYKVLKGREIHARRETDNKAYLRRKLGVVDKQIAVYLASPQLRLRGIVDEVLWLKDGTIAPLDYKYTKVNESEKVFKTHQIQIFWFPRASVGIQSGRASVPKKPRRKRVENAFPRRRVGTRNEKTRIETFKDRLDLPSSLRSGPISNTTRIET